MKRLVLAIGVGVVVLVSSNVKAHNLIVNGGFENGLSSWESHKGGKISIDTTTFHSGIKSLKIEVTNKTYQGAQTSEMIIQPGATYMVECYVYIPASVALEGQWSLFPGISNLNWLDYDAGFTDSTTKGTWLRKSMSFIAFSNTFTLVLLADKDAAGVVYWDDISLTMVKNYAENKLHYQSILEDVNASEKAKEEANQFFTDSTKYIGKDTAEAVSLVKAVGPIPSFALNAGPVKLTARHLVKDSQVHEYIEAVLENSGSRPEECTVTWDSPEWWSDTKGIYKIERKYFQLKPGEIVSTELEIPYTAWNPYNRYPVTCRLEVKGLQSAEKTIEICGRLSQNVRLGEPHSSKEIRENKFGVVLNFGRPIDWSVLSASGIKWVRTYVGVYYPDGKWVSKLEDASWFIDYRDELFNPSSPDDNLCLEYLTQFQNLGINLVQNLPLPRSDKEEDLQKYRSYCYTMAKVMARYGQRWFELGNEPSDKWGNVYGGTWNATQSSPWVPKFCAMVQAGAKGTKEGNPDALVGTGGGVLPANYRILDVGIGPNMDAITDHPYSHAMVPEVLPFGGTDHFKARDGIATGGPECSFISAMQMQKAKCVQTGHPDMDIWVTEWGHSTYFYDGKSRLDDMPDTAKPGVNIAGKFMFEGYTLKTQSKYIARRMVEIAALPEVTISTIYQFIDDQIDPQHPEANFGIVYFGGSYPKPSYYVVQRICSLFSDGVVPWQGGIRVDIPLDFQKLRVGAAWNRPYMAWPTYWEGKAPMLEPRYPRHYVFKVPGGELMLAVWAPLYAQDEKKPDMCDITINVTGYGFPIEIDLLTGDRRDLTMKVDTEKGLTVLENVQVPDYPVVVKLFPADKTHLK